MKPFVVYFWPKDSRSGATISNLFFFQALLPRAARGSSPPYLSLPEHRPFIPHYLQTET